MKDILIATTIRLEPQQLAKIRGAEINLSEWVRNKINEELLSLGEINDTLKDLNERMEYYNKLKEIAKLKDEDRNKVPPEEMGFLIETKKVLDQSPHFVEGRINLYINRFKKPYKLNKAEFFKLLSTAEAENELSKV
jgi:hypothetical protein|tara:strand:- start:4079 stop:4489 length:411 start_codon:yes stop_codon:yes gene_type:complete